MADLRELCRRWVWSGRTATGLPVFGLSEGRLHVIFRFAQAVGSPDVEPFSVVNHAKQAILLQRSVVNPIE